MKVYEAINKVQASLAKEGIGKNRKNQQQGYSFRGIDDVYNALAPMLAANGLCILPRMLSRTVEERINKNGTALFYVTVEAEFDLVSAEDGSKHTIRTYGEAMDSGDKATNKAMSAAYKYACMQSFAIPTEGDNDADATTHEVETAKKKTIRPTDGVKDALDAKRQQQVEKLGAHIQAKFDAGDEWSAFEAWDLRDTTVFDQDASIAVWGLLDSKCRSTIKTMAKEAETLTTIEEK